MIEACRTCLTLIDLDNSPFYLIEADDVRLPTESCRYKLSSLIPEMALNVTPKSMICPKCHGGLETMFEFKARCLETENIITQYFRAKPDVDINNLDLKDVSAFKTSYPGDVKNAVEFVAVKDEVYSSDVDESITVVNHEVDNYSVEDVQPENTVGFKCRVCSKRFASRLLLRSHAFVHRSERRFECGTCQKKFVRRTHLVAHQMIHAGVKSFECEYCDKGFIDKYSLSRHLRTHTGEKPYQCEICDHRFPEKRYLTIHVRKHTGEKPYRCETCDKRFARKVHLRSHLRKHTGEQPYVCTVCNRSFYSKQALGNHERMHDETQPFACSVCGKGCTTNATLEEHMRTHTGEQPYECETCRMRFKTRSNLIRHRQLHSGVKDIECEYCKKRFYRKYHAERHIMTVHKDVAVNRVVIESFNTGVVGEIKEEMEVFFN